MEFENRRIAIEAALFVESLCGNILQHKIGLPMNIETKSFGNTGQALSQSAKVELMRELAIIDKVVYNKFRIIMSVRNQFVHNYDCDKFSDLKQSIIKDIQAATNKKSSSNNDIKDAFEEIFNEVKATLKHILDEIVIAAQSNIKSLQKEIEIKRLVKETDENQIRNYGITDEKEIAVLMPKFREIVNDVFYKFQMEHHEEISQRIHIRIMELLTKK